MMYAPAHTFSGMKVYVTPDVPKMQLSPDCPCTPDFRIYINAWMREFFGTTNALEDGQANVSEAMGKIWMNPRTYARFKDAMQASDGRRLLGLGARL